jgi:hypothetical protein
MMNCFQMVATNSEQILHDAADSDESLNPDY